MKISLLKNSQIYIIINIEESFSFKKIFASVSVSILTTSKKLRFKFSYLKLKITLFSSNYLIWGHLGIQCYRNG